MTQLAIPDAAARLEDLIKRARSGEEVLIADAAGTPIAKLIPMTPSTVENPRGRVFGMFEGKVWMSDDFAAPLTDDELKDWGL